MLHSVPIGSKQIDTHEALLQTVTENQTPVLLQLSAPWCARCQPFSDIIRNELSARTALWLWNDVSNDREIVEYYEITKLPAVIIFDAQQSTTPQFIQSANRETLVTLLDHVMSKRLILDEDF